jgi:prepilin-type N-terminal cleavage/methylation domain-containing protein
MSPRRTTPALAASAVHNAAQPYLRRHFQHGFTLIELMVVIAIMVLVVAFIAPAFTSLKGGGDVTSAAYTIKGVLDQARTYAMANNTYTWVGFFEENVASTTPGTPGFGRLVMSVVASNDGTIIYTSSSPGTIDTTKLMQVGKLTKIDNVHLWTHTDTPLTPTGSTFGYRPNVTSTYCIGDTSPPNSTGTLFQYPVGSPAPTAQYNFLKGVQFSPGGLAQVINSTTSYSPQTAAEIALEPTHGNVTPTSIPANVVAIQFTGVGGNVAIYRR